MKKHTVKMKFQIFSYQFFVDFLLIGKLLMSKCLCVADDDFTLIISKAIKYFFDNLLNTL